MDPRKQIVSVFKRALIQSTEGLRIKNLFGYLASPSRKPLREWFMKMYPTSTDHILFIHDHPRDFNYDSSTGLITVKGKSCSPAVSPGCPDVKKSDSGDSSSTSSSPDDTTIDSLCSSMSNINVKGGKKTVRINSKGTIINVQKKPLAMRRMYW